MPIKLQDFTTSSGVLVSNNRRLFIPLGIVFLLLSSWFLLPTGTKDSSPLPGDIFKPSNPSYRTPTHENYQDIVDPITFENASAIFNTVNAALRPRHSQVLPVGVSFIPAYIPEGTLLYHGNGNGKVPTGLEWIAMDHEFSYWFIANRAGPNRNGSFPGGPGGPPKDGKGRGPPGGPDGHKGPGGPGGPPKGGKDGKGGPPGMGPGGRPGGPGKHEEGNDHVSLLTFQTVKPLDKMILLDGSSGAKSNTGEMDTQMILSQAGVDESIHEYEAAERICKWGKPFGLDGFIRIEVAFEAVICDFSSDKLKLVSNVTLDWQEEAIGMSLEGDEQDPVQQLVASIGGIGGMDQIYQGAIHDKRERRILLDFKGLTTPLNRTYVSPDPYLRRIYNISKEIRSDMVHELEAYLQRPVDPFSGTDWQVVTDEIVDKFSPILKNLNNTLENYSRDSTDDELIQMASNTTMFTMNFVRRFLDHTIKDENEKIESAKKFAVYQYSHPNQKLQSDNDLLIYSSISKVVSEIVELLFEVNKQSLKILNAKYSTKASSVEKYNNAIAAAQERVIHILDALNWVAYYECARKCNWDEVCYTPSWGPNPLGWGSDNVLGAEPYHDRLRASRELTCVSYKTVMQSKSKHH